MMIMETKRLVLRPWKDSDAESLYEYAKNPAVGPAAGWLPHKNTEESLSVIRNILNASECYAVCEKGTDRAIGSIELILNGGHEAEKREDACELGYWLAQEFWGRGYIPEASREMLKRAFRELGMNAVWCCYFEGNEKSRRVQEKLGFHFHHTEREVFMPLLNEVKTHRYNLMTKEDWESGLSAQAEAYTAADYVELKKFWDGAGAITDEDRRQLAEEGIGDPASLAPSLKQYDAIMELSGRSSFLDYGCGCGWASILACRAGIPTVTGVDVSRNSVEAAKVYAAYAGAEQASFLTIDENWLKMQPSETYEVFFSGNVIDVVPGEIAEEIIREAARIITQDGLAIFSLNYALTSDKPAPAGTEVRDGRVYINGILRLVSRTDEEWSAVFERYFRVEKLAHYAWQGEETERRRLFFLKKKNTAE